MAENIRKIIQKVYNAYQKAVTFIGADRLVHMFLSVAATLIGAMILLRVFVWWPVWVAALISAVVVFLVGVAKEDADEEYGGGFDKVDLTWGAAGCVVGFIVCILLM